MTPTSGGFRGITGAAVAYGLTDGAAQSDSIGLTDLGRRAMAPTLEGDDIKALAEAFLRPRVVRDFLTKYDGSKVPSQPIAENVLEEMGVPVDAVSRALTMILENADAVGFLQDLGGQRYVDLNSTAIVPLSSQRDVTYGSQDERADIGAGNDDSNPPSNQALASRSPVLNNIIENRRVFISHGRNRAIVDQLKEVLSFGGFEPVVSVETETVSKPIPDKVMDDMRSCGAGIVHVGGEKELLDKEGNTVRQLNENVLIEIGGALALYRRNFILLVEKGVSLPSNLQGLYEVRYDGDKLDYEATMKLLKAFNDFKSSATSSS
jgi:predicted nucleotide-binding protein